MFRACMNQNLVCTYDPNVPGLWTNGSCHVYAIHTNKEYFRMTEKNILHILGTDGANQEQLWAGPACFLR